MKESPAPPGVVLEDAVLDLLVAGEFIDDVIGEPPGDVTLDVGDEWETWRL